MRPDHSERDPLWTLSFDTYDLRDEGRREAIFALGNGLFVTRAASIDARADEVHYPGTYRAGCYDRVPEEIAGEQVETESLVNLPNWLPLAFRIEDDPWVSIDHVDILDYCHLLDLRLGMSSRVFRFRDAQGRHTRVYETRLVSMAQPHLAALRLELTPENWSGEIEFRSRLDGEVVNDNVRRYQGYTHRHLAVRGTEQLSEREVLLAVRTMHSHVDVAQATRLAIDGKQIGLLTVARNETSITQSFSIAASKNAPVAVEKIVALCTSLDPSDADPPACATKELAAAESFEHMRAAHVQQWQALWERAEIDVEHAEAARALRFHAFHILQTASPHTLSLDVGLPARGWHGEAYRGHVFWDELFVLPFLNFRFPEVAKEVLCYRYRRLDEARAMARAHGYRGAMYPWRSASDGREVTPQHQQNLLTGQWMHDHTYLQRHIGSAVAYNIWQYYLATGDTDFLADCGAEMMLEIARFWASIATPTADDMRYEIRGVIGPDEYHNAYPGASAPGLNNNTYTNLMAVWTLCRALEVLDHLPSKRQDELVSRLGLASEEFALWDRISRNMFVCFHDDGVLAQFEGFDHLPEFSLELLPESLADKRTDWALQAVGKSADAYQITKQADVLTLFYLLKESEMHAMLQRLGYGFECAQLRRTAQYYLTRTTHRSSLSRIVYAGALARLDPDEAWRLYRQALSTDLNALKGESIAEGIHLGAMGGTLDILQRRYLGISPELDGLHLDPALPEELGTVRMRFRYRENDLEIRADRREVSLYSRVENSHSVTVIHSGEKKELPPGEAMSISLAVQGKISTPVRTSLEKHH